MKLVMMKPCAASLGARSGKLAMYCWIWPSWCGSRSLAWMKATTAVGMAAKTIAGKATAPSSRRLLSRSRHSFTKTART